MTLRFRANRWLNGDNRLQFLPFQTLKSSPLSNWTIFLKGSWWKGRLLNRSVLWGASLPGWTFLSVTWIRKKMLYSHPSHRWAQFLSWVPLAGCGCWQRNQVGWHLWAVLMRLWATEAVSFQSYRDAVDGVYSWWEGQVRPCLGSCKGHAPCVNCKCSQNGASDRLLSLIADTCNADRDDKCQKFD